MRYTEWLVQQDPDGGWYASLRGWGGLKWRSLTTQDRERAAQWRDSAKCHGKSDHDKTCAGCKRQ